jgi:Peptidase A4 family
MLSDDDFRKRFDNQLIATNRAGVFSSVAPPQNPALRRLYLSFGLREQDRVIPQLGERRRRPSNHLAPRRRRPMLAPNGANAAGTNSGWAASILTGGTWTSVTGTWNVPGVFAPLTAEPVGKDGTWDMYSWVGLDGWNEDELLQIGVAQFVEPDGSTPAPQAWYEWPAPAEKDDPNYVSWTPISNFPISLQQQVCGMVEYLQDAEGKNYAGSLQLINVATGVHTNLTLNPPPGVTMPGGTAEWVIEDPGGGYPNYTLAGFTPVTFSNATASGPAGTSTPADGGLWNIINTAGVTVTQVGINGTNFAASYYEYEE